MKLSAILSVVGSSALAVESIGEKTTVTVGLIIVIGGAVLRLVWGAARTLDRIESRLAAGDKRFESIDTWRASRPCNRSADCPEKDA